MATNNFLPFCATDTGTNLPTQGDYLADPNRPIGNQPGVASSKFNNKALRQANAIVSPLAQYIADTTGSDTLDDGDSTKMLAIMNAAFMRLPPVLTKYTSGTGTHYKTYYFQIVAGAATAGATYTNNTFTFTVVTTIAAGVLLQCIGTGAPAVAGTLTKSGGTGDTTITFRSVRAPLYMEVEMVGGGGGGGGGGSASGGAGSNGGNTTFGTTLLVANGGTGGAARASGALPAGGSASLGTGPEGTVLTGASGSAGAGQNTGSTYGTGGHGGVTPFGGAGAPGIATTASAAAIANTGSGGGGGGSDAINGALGGHGGAAGGYVKAMLKTLLASYAYAVGALGGGGTLGTNGVAGSAGGSGVIIVKEYFQ